MHCSRGASVASRAHIWQEWAHAAPSPRCAARVPEPKTPVITCMVCQAVPRGPPQCSDHTTPVCCGGLLLWPRREAPALRNTRNPFRKNTKGLPWAMTPRPVMRSLSSRPDPHLLGHPKRSRLPSQCWWQATLACGTPGVGCMDINKLVSSRHRTSMESAARKAYTSCKERDPYWPPPPEGAPPWLCSLPWSCGPMGRCTPVRPG